MAAWLSNSCWPPDVSNVFVYGGGQLSLKRTWPNWSIPNTQSVWWIDSSRSNIVTCGFGGPLCTGHVIMCMRSKLCSLYMRIKNAVKYCCTSEVTSSWHFTNMLIIIIIFYAHQHKACRPRKLSNLTAATIFHSVTIVFWKATVFPCWRAMDSRWNKNVVSLLSSVTLVMRLPISWTLGRYVLQRV